MLSIYGFILYHRMQWRNSTLCQLRKSKWVIFQKQIIKFSSRWQNWILTSLEWRKYLLKFESTWKYPKIIWTLNLALLLANYLSSASPSTKIIMISLTISKAHLHPTKYPLSIPPSHYSNTWNSPTSNGFSSTLWTSWCKTKSSIPK